MKTKTTLSIIIASARELFFGRYDENKKPMKIHVLLPALFVLLTLHSHAATKTWGGGTSTNWNTAANWTNNAVPVAGDDLLFPAGALNRTNNNNTAVASFRSITFTGNGYVVSGNALLLTGTNGITSSQASGSNAITQVISLGTNLSITISTAGASLGLSGSIN